MSKFQNSISYVDALNNANNIKEYLGKPASSRASLEGLDTAIASISVAATLATTSASMANASSSGAANSFGAISTGMAFQLNGAVASASLAATAAYVKQGQFDKAA
ncbi:hypothetical protein [Neisseria dumasiana]|uniref:Uncharacterized protein n=1 Tax=Neisseria dumasiana TaxID=1931275 RepID=A0ABX3WKA8_9NEIS|nr:hypothetical protein [Neisseria dumasiana]OSI34162.1 hypothetical protein BV913_07555 [Neisseria dumasiana]UOO84540.1 hypothetical protein LVJ88_00505 [Neisseria dumasiana]